MEFTASSIASLVGGIVEGDGQATVSTFAKIEEGHPGAISFLANPKYAHYIYSTKSSVVIVAKSFVAEAPIAATLIRVDDPYETIARLLEFVKEATTKLPEGREEPSYVAHDVELPQGAYVGAFAYVGAGAKLGKNVKIYPQVYIGENCEIGADTIIYPGVKIYQGCKIGSRCILHSGAVIGADGFGFAPQPDGSYNKIPQMGIVEIADDVEIGANTTIDRAMMGATKIHQGVKLDNLVQIAHNVEVGQNTAMAAQVGIAGSAKIGKGCQFAGQVGIAGHITVADGAQIGAQSGIPNSVKDASKPLLGSPGIPAMQFARQVAMLRRLGDLFDRVDSIEKSLQKEKK
ncbi:MAG: UDP-3-O-(3-hydroxymyristoyl)glucosamine N-acyltransferase [Bacteroidales bacterium]|nr:UDP-3-O-(3-hydroxymyristoyl)glucosamine N-acyltransferase [Bacteroidales bacterium]